MGRDCLEVGASQIIEDGLATAEDIEIWRKEAVEEVQEAVATAQRERGPDPYEEDWRATSVEGMQ
jgi:TPP-dependent pyruvate/acetoin dehydrogenase alpha subunit